MNDRKRLIFSKTGFSLLSMVLAMAIMCVLLAYLLPVYMDSIQRAGMTSKSKSPQSLRKSLENQMNQINEKNRKQTEQYLKMNQ